MSQDKLYKVRVTTHMNETIQRKQMSYIAAIKRQSKNSIRIPLLYEKSSPATPVNLQGNRNDW